MSHSDSDEVVSKSRRRRMVAQALTDGLPSLATTILERPELLTEHVADVVEGSDVRQRTRALLASRPPQGVMDALAEHLFGFDRTQPTITVEVIETPPEES
jgi:hypothetical protein